jgi:hypothetical protein
MSKSPQAFSKCKDLGLDALTKNQFFLHIEKSSISSNSKTCEALSPPKWLPKKFKMADTRFKMANP